VLVDCRCAAFVTFINVTSGTYFDLIRPSSDKYFEVILAFFVVHSSKSGKDVPVLN
jgi:hypothetical protein